MYPDISPLLKLSLRMGIHSIKNSRCFFGEVGERAPSRGQKRNQGTTKMFFPLLLPRGSMSPKLGWKGQKGEGRREEQYRAVSDSLRGEAKRRAGERVEKAEPKGREAGDRTKGKPKGQRSDPLQIPLAQLCGDR